MRTPPSLFRYLDKRFHFDVDVASTRENYLCPDYYPDSLSMPRWTNELYKTFWNNPPYSKGNIDLFVQKSYEESMKGAVVVCLLPVDFSASWWDYCMEASEWIRIKGRVHFYDQNGQPASGSPFFSSVVVVFDEEAKEDLGFRISSINAADYR